LENYYFFTIIDSIKPPKIVFDTCFIEFSPDSVIGILCDSSTCQCKKQLCDYIINLKKELDLLYIDQFGNFNYGFSFSLKNGDILEYMHNQTGEMENYKKVGEGWYLYDD
jgi:hypothetical protein